MSKFRMHVSKNYVSLFLFVLALCPALCVAADNKNKENGYTPLPDKELQRIPTEDLPEEFKPFNAWGCTTKEGKRLVVFPSAGITKKEFYLWDIDKKGFEGPVNIRPKFEKDRECTTNFMFRRGEYRCTEVNISYFKKNFEIKSYMQKFLIPEQYRQQFLDENDRFDDKRAYPTFVIVKSDRGHVMVADTRLVHVDDAQSLLALCAKKIKKDVPTNEQSDLVKNTPVLQKIINQTN